ncbi:DUF4292 domain-containing protein [Flavihumibacter sp. R14]|nr:DUF4292 domain-containing protein [Flavihumibacter soli]
MLRNLLSSILLVLVFSLFISCKTKKALVSSANIPAAGKSSKAEKLNAINNAALHYSTLSIKAKADLNLNGNSNDATMNVRIRSGEAIWVSVTATAGLEVARALITPDSIKVLNRFESTYINKPFSYIYEFANDQIKFSTLEAIIAGNPIKEVVTEKSELGIQGNLTMLSGAIGSLIYNVQVDGINKVVKTSLKDEEAAQDLLADYSDFIAVQGQPVPHQVSIKSQAERKNIVINLKYSRVELDQAVDMPFSVPKRFTVKN